MKMEFCKTCGTIFDPTVGPCPKCAEAAIMEEARNQLYDTSMPAAEAQRLRKRAWKQIILGVPAMIGLFYLVFYLAKLLSR